MIEEKMAPIKYIKYYLHRVRKLQYNRRETIRTATLRRFISAIRAKVRCRYCMEDYINDYSRTIYDISHDE